MAGNTLVFVYLYIPAPSSHNLWDEASIQQILIKLINFLVYLKVSVWKGY